MTIDMTNSPEPSMDRSSTVSVAEAKSHLSEIIARVEAGDEVVITRRGVGVVKLVAMPDAKPKKIDWAAIRAFAATLPQGSIGAGEDIRNMRDEERY
ncbi:MAG: type II toxin-antitoxin system prevent-host-death family antitoxin [Gammaproteobacteria bacterium]|uniref:type II toxin-antitoxin system Phd/YefM family antitoxin n=1 Tax=Nevskia sp. TaxID=1929292 RepID=UPI004036F5B4|nr:type II toxin-antitoxin system prevent-host-death family antitoxin [Gammaproteobacteria bacterium]